MIAATPNNVRVLRKLAGLSQGQAGALIGVTGVSICTYERKGIGLGRGNTKDLMLKLAAKVRRETLTECPLCERPIA